MRRTLRPGIVRQLERLVGKQNLLTEEHRLIHYTHDATPLLSGDPAAVVIIRGAKQAAAVMRLAYRLDIPTVPRGGGTGLSGGAVPTEGSLVLDLTPMNRIIEIDRKNLTARVEPGVITAVLQKDVERSGLFYPPDPGSCADCTLGGNVAENAGGIRGLKYGVTRDYVLGMEVVLPSGEVLVLGGKMAKDAAGYNLKDLLVGSEGTLAVFTQLLLKLLPKPEAARTWLAAFRTVDQAGEVVGRLAEQRITPACLELIDGMTWGAIQRYGGGAYKDLDFKAPAGASSAYLLIEIDGPEAAVSAEAAAVTSALKKSRAYAVRQARTAKEAERFKSLRRCAFPALSALGSIAILEDAAVPRSAVPAMIKAITRSARRHRVMLGNFGHAGDGNLHPTCLIDAADASQRDRAKAAFAEIYDSALRLGGTITGEHGVGLSKRDVLPKQWSAEGIDLLRRIKAAFDPKGLLNPGKIFRPRPRCE